MKILSFATLLVSATLLPATSHAAGQLESFSGSYNPTTVTQYDGVAVYGATTGTTFSSMTLPVFDSVQAGSMNKLGPVQVQVPSDATNLRAAVFSVYGGQTSFTVALTLDPAYATSVIANGGMSFASVFPGSNETEVAFYIQGTASGRSDAATELESFFNKYNADFPLIDGSNHASGTIVTFSNAASGGDASLSLSPVPEPSTWALTTVGAGFLACGVARRRNKRAA